MLYARCVFTCCIFIIFLEFSSIPQTLYKSWILDVSCIMYCIIMLNEINLFTHFHEILRQFANMLDRLDQNRCLFHQIHRNGISPIALQILVPHLNVQMPNSLRKSVYLECRSQHIVRPKCYFDRLDAQR